MKISPFKVDRKQKPQLKRKLSKKDDFDDETRSPVSGTVIKKLAEGEPVPEIKKGEKRKDDDNSKNISQGDIDPEYNVVEVTEEAKEELAKIDNKIGDYICRLVLAA